MPSLTLWITRPLIVLIAILPSTAQAQAIDLRFATDWVAQAEHGGFYQALAKGYYAKAGLNVTIIQGSPGINIPLLLGAGRVDLALATDSFTAVNIAHAGIPARAIMAVFQKDPQILISHPRDDLPDLAALKGKPIRIAAAARAGYWQWLKNAFGFNDAQIRPYDFNLAPFIIDHKAIQEGYITSEPYLIEREAGIRPQIFWLADYGYAGYGAVIMVSDAFAAKHGEAVTAFIAATQRGWIDFLFGDSTPGRKRIQHANPLMQDDVIEAAIRLMRRYALTESAATEKHGFGAMTAQRWHQFVAQMEDAGVYPPGIAADKIYTLRFLDAARARAQQADD